MGKSGKGGSRLGNVLFGENVRSGTVTYLGGKEEPGSLAGASAELGRDGETWKKES